MSVEPPPLPKSGQPKSSTPTWLLASGHDGEQRSVPHDRLDESVQAGLLSRETLVWSAGMANWDKASHIPVLASLFQARRSEAAEKVAAPVTLSPITENTGRSAPVPSNSAEDVDGGVTIFGLTLALAAVGMLAALYAMVPTHGESDRESQHTAVLISAMMFIGSAIVFAIGKTVPKR